MSWCAGFFKVADMHGASWGAVLYTAAVQPFCCVCSGYCSVLRAPPLFCELPQRQRWHTQGVVDMCCPSAGLAAGTGAVPELVAPHSVSEA